MLNHYRGDIIMEDFVTYKLAKKLKEKGYPQHWSDDDYIVENEYDDNFEVGSRYDRCFIPEHLPTISAPTISQVLKWLREEKKIHINVDIDEFGWEYRICKFQKVDNEIYNFDLDYLASYSGEFMSYEQAALSAIEYVLDNNLI